MSEMVHKLGETLHLHHHHKDELGEHKQGLRDRIKGKIKEKIHRTDVKDKKKKKKNKNKKGGLFANNNENVEEEEEEEEEESGSSGESESHSEEEEEEGGGGGEEEEEGEGGGGGGGGKWGKLAKATVELVGAVLGAEV